ERRTVEEGRPAWNTCIRMLHSHCDHEGRRKIHLETTMTQPDGRAPVAGLNLEVGEPISTTQMVDTTIYQTIGEEMDAIAMITGPNRYFLVAFNSNFLPE
ncbi:MAG TPA: hypothetical protein VNQ76_20780, partial [Planctomicrobium sp.]|nr:hypothetical protein [Planctomicrobium sp.]